MQIPCMKLIINLHKLDPTLKTYKYPPDESMKEVFREEIVRKMKSLSLGESIEIDADESKKLGAISNLLNDKELAMKL